MAKNKIDRDIVDVLQSNIDKINEEIKHLHDKRNIMFEMLKGEIESDSILRKTSEMRINSQKKLRYQANIRMCLAENGRQMKVNEIYSKLNIDKDDCNSSSFRNYISEMKEKGLIEKGDKSGYWKIPNKNKY